MIPSDVKQLIIYFQMESFVYVKDVNRNHLFQELWLHASSTYKSTKTKHSDHYDFICDIEFKVSRAKMELKHKTFANRIFNIPMKIDIYSKEDFINCDFYDKFYGQGNCQKIVNIVKQCKRPNIKNFTKIVKICNDIQKIEGNKTKTLHLIRTNCFPLKKNQKVVMISDKFHDNKFRVVADALMAEETNIDKTYVIIEVIKTYDLNIDTHCFVVLPIHELAIYKK